MTITVHGRIRGKTIELDEDIGATDGQEVQVTVVQPVQSAPPPMSEGLGKIYEILGERYESGHSDTAARHSEHQP